MITRRVRCLFVFVSSFIVQRLIQSHIRENFYYKIMIIIVMSLLTFNAFSFVVKVMVGCTDILSVVIILRNIIIVLINWHL